MLEITRQPNGAVFIPKVGVTIRAIGINPHTGSIILGIDAPRELDIVREEIATGEQLEVLKRARSRRPA